MIGAIALLTLSAGAQHASTGKGDRLASPVVATTQATSAAIPNGVVTNVSSRTTTVAKGAASSFHPASPYAQDFK
ncbi:hypothetical protein [Methylopila turkensis]|uniref:hypothetical protein n=1 Tax=Methylopila turkensis TaxID=1437816 RepID=UPI0022F315EB|nr:hypothetical protein [Methylopila turkensis]